MIFVTVGHQTPFDRLIQAVDQWALTSNIECFAQIGTGRYTPEAMDHARFLNPGDFRKAMRNCELVVAHAGIGSIVDALELGKRIVVLPRRAALMETRNDHQLATASRFENRPGLHVAPHEDALPATIAEALASPPITPGSISASQGLVDRVKSFVMEGR